MLGGCEAKFRNLNHETWVAIRFVWSNLSLADFKVTNVFITFVSIVLENARKLSHSCLILAYERKDCTYKKKE